MSEESKKDIIDLWLEEYAKHYEPPPSEDEGRKMAYLSAFLLSIATIALLGLNATRTYEGFYFLFAGFDGGARTVASLLAAAGLDIALFAIPFYYVLANRKKIGDLWMGVLSVLLLTLVMAVGGVSVASAVNEAWRESLYNIAAAAVAILTGPIDIISGLVVGEIAYKLQVRSHDALVAWRERAMRKWHRSPRLRQAFIERVNEMNTTEDEPSTVSKSKRGEASAMARSLIEKGYDRASVVDELVQKTNISRASARAIVSRLLKEGEA